MNDKFPSIWLEYTDLQGQKMIIGGFYREWDRNGKASIEAQATRIEILANQIDSATACTNNVILMGDANLCFLKWYIIQIIQTRSQLSLTLTMAEHQEGKPKAT